MSFQKNKKFKNLLLTSSVFNALISKSSINFSYWVDVDIAFQKKFQNTKNKIHQKGKHIWTRGPKCKERKTVRDQSDFGLLSHQVCLETKQLGGKRQIILSINNEGISHIKREGN